jgi:hypothetical protein
MGKEYEIKGNLGCHSRHSPFLEAETLRSEFDVIWDDILPTVLRKGKSIPGQVLRVPGG